MRIRSGLSSLLIGSCFLFGCSEGNKPITNNPSLETHKEYSPDKDSQKNKNLEKTTQTDNKISNEENPEKYQKINLLELLENEEFVPRGRLISEISSATKIGSDHKITPKKLKSLNENSMDMMIALNKLSKENLNKEIKIIEGVPGIDEIDRKIKEKYEVRCIDVINIVGLQGGYTNLFGKKLGEDYFRSKFTDFRLTYGIKDKKNILPSKSKIESEISAYVGTTILYGIKNKDHPGLENLDLKSFTKTEIKPESVELLTKVLITIERDNLTTSKKEEIGMIRNYKKNIPIRFGKIYEIANKAAEEHINYGFKNNISGELDLAESLISLEKKYPGIEINTKEEGKNLLYIVTDRKSGVNTSSYSFVFGVERK